MHLLSGYFLLLFLKSTSQFPIISARQFAFIFSWNLYGGDVSPLSVTLRRGCQDTLSDGCFWLTISSVSLLYGDTDDDDEGYVCASNI